MSRESRNLEKRAYDERDAKQRPLVSFGDHCAFNIREDFKHPDKDYFFISYRAGGENSADLYDDAIDRYMEPVLASNHPGMRRAYVVKPFASRDGENDEAVRYQGQILMYRDKEVSEAERKHYNEETARNEYVSSLYRNNDMGAPKLIQDDRQWGLLQ